MDEQGNILAYNYDSVGNLLSITEATGPQSPQITAITPSSALQGDNLSITITGDNLSGAELSTDNSITISNVSTSKTTIMATFSISYQARVGVTVVTVKTSSGLVLVNFTVNARPPSITALSPTSGPVSRLVSLIGTGFSLTPSENIVSFNGIQSQIITASATTIFTDVPAGATSGPVTVTVNSLTSNGVYFTVFPSEDPPTISSLTPNVGSVEGSGLVTIAGSGFTSDTKVYIGGKQPLDLQIVDSSTIQIKTPPGSEGPADVLLTNINGDAFIPDGFTYLAGSNESILLINPPLGFINIPVNTNISVLFTMPVDRATVTDLSFMVFDNETDAPVSGDISFDFGDRASFFRPLSLLNQNTTYRISITQDIKSSDGIPLDAPFTGFFTTGTVADTISPTVSTSPADGETVPYNASIIFTFSEPINPVTINAYSLVVTNNSQPKDGEIVIGQSNTIVTFIPYAPFLPDTPVYVTLSSKVTDIAGNSIIGSGGPDTDLVFSFNAATNADYMPPRVLYINPTNVAAGVNPNTSISVTFTEPVNPVTVNSNSFLVSSEGMTHSGEILFSNRNTIATFIPDQTLPFFQQITVALTTDITDVSGNAMLSDFTSRFTTATGVDNFQPMLVSVSPADRSNNVPLNARIQVVLSERLDPFTVNNGTFYLGHSRWDNVSGEIDLSDDGMVITLTPASPLLPNASYGIYLTQGITDVAGNPLYQSYAIGFCTGSTLEDGTGPVVTGISPVTGASEVPTNANVVMQFSEPVAGTTVNDQTVIVSAGGVPVPGEITLEQENKVLRWKRANLELLEPNALYEITITTRITDVAGNPLQNQYESFFTTGSDTDTVAPEVISISPANSSQDIALDTSIIITFSEPINPASINGSFDLRGGGVDGNIQGSFSLSEDRMP